MLGTRSVRRDEGKVDIGFEHVNTNIELFLTFFSLVVLPPIGEEVLIRGYLFGNLRRYLRFLPSLIITSLLFGAAHLEFGTGKPLVWMAGVDTAILAVFLAYLREKTGSIWAGVVVHGLNNLLAFIYLFHSQLF